MENPFVLHVDQYVRDIDPVSNYKMQAAKYLEVTEGLSPQEAKAMVQETLNDGSFKIKVPNVIHLERDEVTGDREKKSTPLLEYLYSSMRNQEIIAPTGTTYIPHHKKLSVLVDYIDGNIRDRDTAKHEKFKALAVGDKALADDKDREQNNKKTRNNSLSGAQVSSSTPLFNKTAHSSLTSNCRSTSGYGNANNEKFLYGNRHYWAVDVVINNITSIITNTDYLQLARIIEKYNIHIPTADEVRECIKYSTDFYWRDPKGHVKIDVIVSKLDDLQRAAFVYTGDFYHFAKYNRQVAYDILTGLSTKVTGEFPDALAYVKSCNGEYVDHARHICIEEMTGKTKVYKDYENSVELQTLAGTVKKVNDTVAAYSDFIKCFWVTKNVPASLGYFPDSIRRSALVSDTDSTIFTVENWVWWYYEKDQVKPGSPVAAAIVFLAAQTITHVLAIMSVNMGVEKKRLFDIAMKNEYAFYGFVPTNVGKHYFAERNVQEGIILTPKEYELKGVHLKNSNAPAYVNKMASDMMEDILTAVTSGQKIKVMKYIKQIADLERQIHSEIAAGSDSFLRKADIKNPEAYSNVKISPYVHYLLWRDVFAPKYGDYGEPPYGCVRLTTTLDSPTKTVEWLNKMKDQDLANRMRQWLTANGKNHMPSLLIPVEALRVNGMPPEILDTLDVRGLVINITKTLYLIMETLGIYVTNDKNTKLLSDRY